MNTGLAERLKKGDMVAFTSREDEDHISSSNLPTSPGGHTVPLLENPDVQVYGRCKFVLFSVQDPNSGSRKPRVYNCLYFETPSRRRAAI